jgi:hypothetical protein
LGFGFEHPISFGIVDAIQITNWYVNPKIAILASRINQQNIVSGV